MCRENPGQLRDCCRDPKVFLAISSCCRAPEAGNRPLPRLQRGTKSPPAAPLACEHLGPSGFGLPPVFSPKVEIPDHG